ncbi:MAG: proteophosphoglycan 5 [Anaerolineae bacterium]
MSLVQLDLPSPLDLRGGWAAFAAVCAARGWSTSAYATADQWLFHDGGGNWACLRFKDSQRAILIGHDHEYSETYYGEAAQYFQEEETDLLAEAPDWWGFDLNPRPFGEWVGFIYGWENQAWRRAGYTKSDGFNSVGLLKACSMTNTELLKQFASDAPGLNGQDPDAEALKALVAADGSLTHDLLDAVVPGWDIEAGIAAARNFLSIDLTS